ncbi:MAG TPA: adenylate/guanylate cyclase domain-containing protein [Candidatus Acidoferrales bacterium]|nr:adenylate/guanylate cyclase domain-containing protein [Candidatus Acidoferrales bacterium]
MASPKPSHHVRFSWRTFLFGIVLLGLIFAFHDRFHGAFERLDLDAYDLRINTMTPRPSSGLIVIAAVDDKSISELGQWPWPRQVLGKLVNALTDYKVKVIGFDAIFSEPDKSDVARSAISEKLAQLGLTGDSIRDVLGPSNDEAFAKAMKAQGNVVLGYEFQSHLFQRHAAEKTLGFLNHIRPPGPLGYGIVRKAPGKVMDMIMAEAYQPPFALLEDAAHSTAYFDVDADADGVIRTDMTVIRFDGRYCAPLFLAITDAYADGATMMLGLGPNGVTGVSVAGVQIPVDDDGRMLVNFRRGPNPFPHYSISDIINHKIAPEKLAGRIVLVGATAHGLGDRGVTPVDGDMPRVEIHANAIDNVIQGDFVRRSYEATEIAFFAALLMGIAMSLGVAWLSAMSSAAVGVILLVGYYGYAQHRLLGDGLVIGIVFPMFTAFVIYMFLAGYRYITEGREKRYLRTAFEHYLNPDVITSLLDSPEGLKLGGERRHLAILFADIVSFTKRAEKTTPEDLLALLNTYMTSMIEVIFNTGGVVDKLMGDGIMAFWGAPNDLENPSRSAIDCALKMLQNLHVLQTTDPRFADLDIGIGISTGDVVVGNLGGENRFDYSVIGDTVNFASRLEGLTRHFKVHLLVSRETYTEAGAGYIGRELGLVKVKGKELYVSIVHVAGRDNDGVDPSFYRHFGDALTMIRAGDVFSARQELEQLGQTRPDDTPVRIYLDKLAADPDHPPTEMVFEFESK